MAPKRPAVFLDGKGGSIAEDFNLSCIQFSTDKISSILEIQSKEIHECAISFCSRYLAVLEHKQDGQETKILLWLMDFQSSKFHLLDNLEAKGLVTFHPKEPVLAASCQSNSVQLYHVDDTAEATEELVVMDCDAVDLDLNHRRIAKIENLESLRCVETICLRWNLIKKIENLDSLSSLRELELYDNQITQIENLSCLVNLEVLDISFNRIRKIENLEGLTKLKKLFLCANKISKIENLNHLQQLELLELGDNKIRTIENIDSLTNLQSLFLGKNKISKLQNLDSLINLQILGIQSNRITKMEGLGRLVCLQQLYLSHNGVLCLEGLANNTQLQTLDLACNRIARIENVAHLTCLEEFWFNGNSVSNWKDVQELRQATGLQTVYLEGNPIHQDPNYRRKLKLELPSLVQIDATLCR